MANLEKEIKELKEKLNSIEKTINGQKNSLFGKPQSSLGSTASDTVIQTLGTLKVRFGNKFVTIFKDGKLVTDTDSKLIYTGTEVGNKDGLYIIKRSETEEPSIYLVYKGISYLLATSESSFLSFNETQKLNSNNKEIVQRNIGIICSDLNELDEDKIQQGFIYCLKDNKFYTINDNQISEYKTNIPKELEIELLKLNDIVFSKSGINTKYYFNINSNQFGDDFFQTRKVICNEISSPYQNFSISEENGEYVLNIDKIISDNVYEHPSFYPYFVVKYSYEVLLNEENEVKYFYKLEFNKELELINGDLIFIDGHIFEYSDSLFKSLNGSVDFTLKSKCAYPIKINGIYTNLFELSDEFKMIIPNIKTTDSGTYEVDLSNVVLKFGKENDKSGLVLYTGDQFDYIKYADNSTIIPYDCNNKVLITKEWIINNFKTLISPYITSDN